MDALNTVLLKLIKGGKDADKRLNNLESSPHIQLSTKITTGDLATAYEGMVVINTFDNNIKMYADGGWRVLGTW